MFEDAPLIFAVVNLAWLVAVLCGYGPEDRHDSR